MDNTLPPLPEGFQLMQPGQSALPPLPEGFQLMQPGSGNPPAPPPGMYGNGPLQTMSDFNTGIGEAIPFKNQAFAGIAAPFRAGYGYLTGGDSSLGDAYHKELDRLNKMESDANARSPIATTAGSVAATLLAGPEAMGAEGIDALAASKGDALVNAVETPASRFAKLWAGAKSGAATTAKAALGTGAYGGALGASDALNQGDDWGDVMGNGLKGFLWGAGAGAAGVPIGKTIGTVGDQVVAPMVRAITNKGKQAGLNIASFLGRDASAMAGKEIPQRGLTMDELKAYQDQGYPVLNIHLGGSNVANAARAAADASSDAENAILKGTTTTPGLDAIHSGQLGRYEGVIDSYLPEGGAQAARNSALAEGRAQTAPLYDAAYANPNAQDMYHEGYEQLMQSPIFQQAMKGAIKSSQDEAALAGANVVLPKFVYKNMGDGTKRLTWVPEQGNPTPSLPFWNEVKKNLDDIIGAHTDSITKQADNEAVRAIKLKGHLLDFLDDRVPEYATAREAAGRYLGENNAFDAGTKLYSQANGPKLNVDVAAKQIAGWTPAERQAAGSAYLDALKNDLYSKARTTSTGTKDLSIDFLKSDKAQKVGTMLLGKDVMDQLGAHNAIERLMAQRRNDIIGGSKTNRFQQARSLLAPVAFGVGEDAWEDPENAFDITDLAHLSHMGKMAALGFAVKFGHRGLSSQIQKTLAPEIASRLMAGDSSAYVPALRSIASDPTTMGWMRLLSRAGSGAAAQYGAQ